MDISPERWQKIGQLYHTALECEPGERSAFLDQACQGDVELRRDVEALLAQRDAVGDSTVTMLTPGAQLGPYQIEAPIGAGGMGSVYRAVDTRLGRKVAIKICAQQFSGRFEREARAISSLNHPHICTLYDVGPNYLVMELVEGETLAARLQKGRLPMAAVLRYAAEIADAVAAAHALGIIHRDLKPQNIMITKSGVKVLDFGLAKSPTDETLTAARVVMGTPAYMAPEQMEGKECDARSDIYALGLVLHEMAAGKRLPRGQPPVMEGLPPQFAHVIERCVESEPENRWQSASDVKRELEWAGTTQVTTQATESRKGLPRWIWGVAVCVLALGLGLGMYWKNRNVLGAITSIAVLPLTNSGTDPNWDYMSDGLTETLINNLSRIRTVRVMSRSAVFRFKANKISPLEQGKALNVDAILTGTMRNISGQIELDVELVEVNTGRQLWGELYRQPTSDLLRLQQSTVEAIATQLRVRLDAQEKLRVTKDYTANVDAYRLYLKGRYEWNKRNMEGYQKAVDYFRGAIDLDPTYALAYSGLADANSYQVGLRMADEIFPAARTAARKAIELDSSLAEGHASLGFILLHYDWDWAGAERELRIALELNPNYASARSTYGRLLSATARFQEAEAEILKAQQLDPLSLAIANGLALHYYLSRRYNLAEKQFRRNLSIDPASTHTMSLLAYNYLQQNRLPDAIHQYEQLLANDPDDLDTIPDLARAYASVGRKSDSLYLLAHLQEMAKKRVDVLPTFFAEVYAALGQLDKTFAYLDEAYRERTWQLIFLRVEPVWDPLRGDARFKQLLGKMGL